MYFSSLSVLFSCCGNDWIAPTTRNYQASTDHILILEAEGREGIVSTRLLRCMLAGAHAWVFNTGVVEGQVHINFVS